MKYKRKFMFLLILTLDFIALSAGNPESKCTAEGLRHSILGKQMANSQYSDLPHYNQDKEIKDIT